MEKDLEDIRWVEATRLGKTESFAPLVDKYKDKVFSLAMGILKQREEAEEAAQDVFVKAFKALSGFRGNAKFSTWIYRIAYNECISRHRKRKPQTVSFADVMPGSQLSATENEDHWQETERRSHWLHAALKRLSETDRGLVHFFYFDNLSVEEIARISGLSVSNVKTKLFRIRKKLFNELATLNKEMQIQNIKH